MSARGTSASFPVRFWRWFFPERAEPPPELLALLARVYPTLDLSAVTFHRG